MRQVQQKSTKKVRFVTRTATHQYQDHKEPFMVTYYSGADGNYTSEADRKKLGLPILRESTRRVGVANLGASKGKHVISTVAFPTTIQEGSRGRYLQ